MWTSLLGALLSDLPSNFPYQIDSDANSAARPLLSSFALHKGHHRTEKGQEVSVFLFDKKNKADQRLLPYAARALRKAKSIRHPSFLPVLEALETPSAIYIVTEPVEDLEAFARQPRNRELWSSTLSWNFYKLAEGIRFLHKEANSFHGGLSLHSIFATRTGEWMIGPMELCHSQDELSPFSIAEFTPLLLNHPACVIAESGNSHQILNLSKLEKRSAPFVLDRICFAGIVATVLTTCRKGWTRDLKWSVEANIESVPAALTPMCTKLSDYETACVQVFDWSGMLAKLPFFRDSDLVISLKFMDEIALKGNWDKEKFFATSLPALLDEKKFSRSAQTRLILPRISSILLDAATVPSLHPKLLNLFARLVTLVEDAEEFHALAWPPLRKLLSTPERSTRYVLLSIIDKFEACLTEQDAIDTCEPILAGLSDAAVELRDVTLRAMLFYIPKMKRRKDLLDRAIKLMSLLLQRDESDQIRTNAVICFAKLIDSLEPGIVASEVAPHFVVGMRDRFPPCRLASIQAVGVACPHLRSSEIAQRYLPALCLRLVDPDPQTKCFAFQTAEFMLGTLKATELVPVPSQSSAIPKTLPTMALAMLKQASLGIGGREHQINAPRQMNEDGVDGAAMRGDFEEVSRSLGGNSDEANARREAQPKSDTEPPLAEEDAFHEFDDDDDWLDGGRSDGGVEADSLDRAAAALLSLRHTPAKTTATPPRGETPAITVTPKTGGDEGFWNAFNVPVETDSKGKKSLAQVKRLRNKSNQ